MAKMLHLNYCLIFIIIFLFIKDTSSQQKCKCGKTTEYRLKRIINSKSAGHNEYPWFASIFYHYKYICGGNIISNAYILTAGHCLGGELEKMFVVVGNKEIFPSIQSNQLRVRSKTVHRQFHKKKYQYHENDIGLLRLMDGLEFIPGKVWPVCLPNYWHEYNNLVGTIVASEWKTIRNYKVGFMKKGYVSMISENDCKNSLIASYISNIDEKIICAKSDVNDACQGDSGGPLLFEIYNSTVLAGIISFGIDCGNPHYPGIYTNVKYYLDWIKKNTLDANYCD